MSYNELKLSSQLCHPLYSATNALMRIYKPLLKQIGVTYPQYLILMSLWEQDNCNIQQLSETTFFDSGTLTPLLKKLKELNLIQIKVDKGDKRNRIISLTAKGSNLQEKARAIPHDLFCIIGSSKSDFLKNKEFLETLYKKLVAYEQKNTA